MDLEKINKDEVLIGISLLGTIVGIGMAFSSHKPKRRKKRTKTSSKTRTRTSRRTGRKPGNISQRILKEAKLTTSKRNYDDLTKRQKNLYNLAKGRLNRKKK